MVDNEIENRSKVIVRTSIVGIATNVVLSAFKAAIGFITGSIAVTLDAVKNLEIKSVSYSIIEFSPSFLQENSYILNKARLKK